MSRSIPAPGLDVGVFERALLDAPDLLDLSWAARRLLVAAATLFHRDGAAATSVRDITGACGLSPGALYAHFASKDDVLYRLACHGHLAMEARVDTAMAEAGEDPVQRFSAFVRAYVIAHLERPELAQLVRREYLHLTPARHAEIVGRRRRIRQQLGGLIREGVQDGAFSLLGPAQPTAVAVMVLDMCSRTSEWYDPRRAEPAARVADRYVAGALRLCGAPDRG